MSRVFYPIRDMGDGTYTGKVLEGERYGAAAEAWYAVYALRKTTGDRWVLAIETDDQITIETVNAHPDRMRKGRPLSESLDKDVEEVKKPKTQRVLREWKEPK